MMFSRVRQGKNRWSDGWDGYPASRQRIIDHIAEANVENAVVVSGDIHQFWVSDVKRDFEDPDSATVATEFVGSSITSDGGGWAEAILPDNPHVQFHDWRRRGYGRGELTPNGMTMDLVAMESVADPDAAAYTLASYSVEPGRPGALES